MAIFHATICFFFKRQIVARQVDARQVVARQVAVVPAMTTCYTLCKWVVSL
jgi:hypothetical protein